MEKAKNTPLDLKILEMKLFLLQKAFLRWRETKCVLWQYLKSAIARGHIKFPCFVANKKGNCAGLEQAWLCNDVTRFITWDFLSR